VNFNEEDEELAFPGNLVQNEVVFPKWIGNVRCWWHNKDGVPRVTIGPNWGFTFFLGGIVCAVLWLSFGALKKMFEDGA